MDIAGNDLVFQSPVNREKSIKLVKELINQLWINARYEPVDDGDFFVYEDEASQKAWEGDVPEGKANMIYALFRDKEITLVHDIESESVAKTVARYFSELK
jgi:hypothetical protein